MSPDPRVSIVTPSFNQAQFLEQTIRSVLQQGYPNLEYLVMDGGSTDGSVEVIQRHARQLAYWVSEADGGQADAVNKGWRRASGSILAYLNSDDLYLPGVVARVVEFLADHPDVDVVYGALQMIDVQGAPLELTQPPPKATFAWLLRRPLPQPTVFLRRSVLDRIGLFDPTLHYVFDWELFLRASLAGVRMARMPGPPLAAFRCWDGQKTAEAFEPRIKEQLRVRDQLLAQPDLAPRMAREIRFSKAWAYLWPAYQCYLKGSIRMSRRLLHEATEMHRGIAIHPEFLRLYARLLLGRRLSSQARALKAWLNA